MSGSSGPAATAPPYMAGPLYSSALGSPALRSPASEPAAGRFGSGSPAGGPRPLSAGAFASGGGAAAPSSASALDPRLSSSGLGSGALDDIEDPDFDEMISDLRRAFVGWLQRTQAEIKQRRSDLRRERQSFEEEKLSVWHLFMAEKQREVEKIREDKLRAEEETAAIMRTVQADLEEHRRRLDEERVRLEQEGASRRRNVAHEYEKFKQEYGLFEADRQRIVNPMLAAEATIDLNVGGTVFETARSTLVQQQGSYLEALLSGRYNISRDRYGRIFLDRDPEYFRAILNFLRNPQTPPMPRDGADSEALVREAAYYGIHFFPWPLVFAVGGHDGYEHLRAVEVLDVGNQCWRPCRPMSTDRTYFGAATLRNRLHVFGGQNLEYRAMFELEVYDCLRDSWEAGAPMRFARRNCASAEHDGRIYAIGGFDGTKISNSVEAYDSRLKNWMQVADLPTPRSSAMSASVDGKVLVMGGTSGTRMSTVDVFDPRANRWDTLKFEMCAVRSAGQAVCCVNHLFALGGIDNEQNIHVSMEALDTDSFSMRQSMQEARMEFAAACISDSIMVGGGQNGGVLSSTEFYRPELDEWQAGPSMMIPRYGHQYLICTL